MTPAQKRAIEKHRKNQTKKGNVRLELSVPGKDRDLMRRVAAQLRSDGSDAERLRLIMQSALEGETLIDFKKYLELVSVEDLDLDRDREPGIRNFEL